MFGVVVRSRGLGGNIMAGLRSIVGGEILNTRPLLEEARRHAVDRMVQNAPAMGANAIIMMRFDSSEIGQVMSEIVAYGTAAVLEPERLARSHAAHRAVRLGLAPLRRWPVLSDRQPALLLGSSGCSVRPGSRLLGAAYERGTTNPSRRSGPAQSDPEQNRGGASSILRHGGRSPSFPCCGRRTDVCRGVSCQGRASHDLKPRSTPPSFPRKRESRAEGSLVALDSRFRGNDGDKSCARIRTAIALPHEERRKKVRS